MRLILIDWDIRFSQILYARYAPSIKHAIIINT